jgi:moderate conductance mechanosensitive channel
VIWVVAGDQSHTRPALRRELSAFANLIVAACLWAVAGIALLTILRQWQTGQGLRDLIGTLLVSLPTLAILILAYWRHGRGLAVSLCGPRPRSNLRKRLAPQWPRVAIGLVILSVLLIQISNTMGSSLPPLAFLVTLVLALLAPHLDDKMAKWAAGGLMESRLTVAAVAARRTARLALLTLCLAAIATVWASPIAGTTGFAIGDLARPAAQVAGIVLAAAFVWNLLGVATDKMLTEDATASGRAEATDEAVAPKSRLSTLLPLLVAGVKAALLALAMLTVLLALGVNVWPLVTGLSVFGLAIGFGSQTLVKDVVSGLFFLVDDALRLGEYVETSGAKGTVEKISLRSVSLRHPRGALATIPYGQIGKIQNFSRDWVIEKILFRVAFDTDVDLVRKIFKQIGQDIMQDAEVAKDILEPFKSQGIYAVEDGTLVIRGKYKAVAGQQFTARKAILAAVQKAFREHGIKVVPKSLVTAA